MQAVPTAPDLALPPAVRKFCEERGVLEFLNLALRLAARTFELHGDPRLTVETDPETDEQSVVIDVFSTVSCDEGLEQEHQFTRQWVGSVPPDVIGTICLILNIA